jgi:SagB-type dehydrogenase family enzyme
MITKLLLLAGNLFFVLPLYAQLPQSIQLLPPDTGRGLSVMAALSHRESVRDFDSTELSLRDLSDLLWAANGVNRPAEGKRTAPSAINAQDIDVYVFLRDGVYRYEAGTHTLDAIIPGDRRTLFSGGQSVAAPPAVICLLVSDLSRFTRGSDSLRLVWAAMDAGIVSQNIALFCASVALVTRPRASMDHNAIREALSLTSSQRPMLNLPVSRGK